MFAVILIVALASLNLRGISEAADADFAIVVFKVSALIVFIVWALGSGVHLSSNLAQPPASGVSGIFSASVIAMFAYAGFQSIATMAPNIKGGGRTAARAIVAAVVISLVLYVLVTLALLALLPVGQFGFRADPLSFALSSAGGPTWLSLLIAFAALAATASATLAMIIASSQLLLQLSGDGLLPGILGQTRAGHKSALGALVLTIVFGTLFMFLGNIYIIAAVSNFGVLFSYLLSGFALLKIRRMRRQPERHQEALREAGVPARGIVEMPWFPYLPMVGIGFLIVFFFAFPTLALSIGLGVVLVSILVYYVLREDRDEPVIKVRFFR